MNRFSWIAASALLVGVTGLALAQDSNTAAASGTPAAAADSSSTGSTAAPAVPQYPGKVVVARIKNQYKRIREGVRAKKLTYEEGKDLKAKVDAVRDQLKADAAQNKQSGAKKITDDQYAQLKQMLDDNSKAIHDEKNDGETDANAAPADNSASTGNASAPAADSSTAGTASSTPSNQ